MSKSLQALLEANAPEIILASASPRRKELLDTMGLKYKVIVPEFDEKQAADHSLSPVSYAGRLAQAKGLVVARKNPDSLVIAADTIVVIDNEILEKPLDEMDAISMLQRLQGTQHSVITAISLYYAGRNYSHYNETKVWMVPLNIETISKYVLTGESMDKAGAYALQGRASCFIQKIDGCFSNVIGLSLPLLRVLLRDILSTQVATEVIEEEVAS